MCRLLQVLGFGETVSSWYIHDFYAFQAATFTHVCCLFYSFHMISCTNTVIVGDVFKRFDCQAVQVCENSLSIFIRSLCRTMNKHLLEVEEFSAVPCRMSRTCTVQSLRMHGGQVQCAQCKKLKYRTHRSRMHENGVLALTVLTVQFPGR